MKFLLFLTVLLSPLLLVLLQVKYRFLLLYYRLAAIVSAILFGTIISSTIYEVIRDQIVFMTTVHKILLHPGFLMSGAYLGVYGMFLLYRSIVSD